MITKFQSVTGSNLSLEIQKKADTVSIEFATPTEKRIVEITPDDLFNLIGQLLRIQSEFKSNQKPDKS